MSGPDLISFDEWSERAPGLSIRTVRRLMAQGRWPAAIRLSPSGPLLWSRQSLNSHFEALLAPLDQESAS